MIIRKILMLAFVILNANASNVILKQGEVEVTFDDIDGYAYTIPEDKREGFFSSKVRIEKTLTNILNIKNIVSYARKHNLVDVNKVNETIKLKLLESNTFNEENILPIVGNYENYKNYLLLIETYKYFQLNFKSKIDKTSLEEVAQEMYTLNKEHYKTEELRDFIFVELEYDELNKTEKVKKLQNLQKEILKINNFKKVIENQKSKDIYLSKEYKDFKFEIKYLKFSEHIFSTSNIGLIPNILDIKPKLYLVNLNKINKSHYLSFDEVKDNILNKLIVQKYERDFQNLLDSITKEDIEIKSENLQSLTSRYSKLVH
jgi:hypothetical protein